MTALCVVVGALVGLSPTAGGMAAAGTRPDIGAPPQRAVEVGSATYDMPASFCSSAARPAQSAVQQPCSMMLTTYALPASTSNAASPNGYGWYPGTSWVEACSNDSNGACYTWNDTVTCSYEYDASEVYETSCSASPHTSGGVGWSLTNTGSGAWYGCSPQTQYTTGGTISCGANFVVCASGGNCMNGWMRMAIDTYGDLTGPTGGCTPQNPMDPWPCTFRKG